MVDNFEQIKKLLKFDSPTDFYFVQVIQRKKDHKEENIRLGRNNNARLIKAFYVYSVEQLEEYRLEMIQLAQLFNARIGINLNRRDNKKVALEMMEQLAHNIKSENYNVAKLYNSCCGMVLGGDKLWIVDIDNKEEKGIAEVSAFIDTLQPEGETKIKAVIPTKNGVHLITTAFNSLIFGKAYPDIEIHKNNPTVLYVP